MSINKNTFILTGWVIVICLYFVFIFIGLVEFKSSFYVLLLIVLNTTVWLLNCYFVKQKIKRMKKELNVVEDLSLEELESLRIEKDYQENFVKKLNLE